MSETFERLSLCIDICAESDLCIRVHLENIFCLTGDLVRKRPKSSGWNVWAMTTVVAMWKLLVIESAVALLRNESVERARCWIDVSWERKRDLEMSRTQPNPVSSCSIDCQMDRTLWTQDRLLFFFLFVLMPSLHFVHLNTSALVKYYFKLTGHGLRWWKWLATFDGTKRKHTGNGHWGMVYRMFFNVRRLHIIKIMVD